MTSKDKLDLYKLHKGEYVTPKTPQLIEAGSARYISIEGQGGPGDEDFQAKMQALYGAAFTIKMTSKFAGRDYKVCHLEGLWWGDTPGGGFFELPRSRWRWRLMIRTPEFIGEGELAEAKTRLLAKGKGPEVESVTLADMAEGLCVQVLHVGPYDSEGETIERMRSFAADEKLSFHGLHHELYLSDARRVPPERLRTILRHPVR